MIREIDVTELKEILDREPGAALVDVREEEEFRGGRADRAVLAPLSSFNPAAMEKTLNIRKDQTIYLICRSGARSMRAAMMMEQAGYRDLVNIAGGTLAWVEEGYPTRRG